MVAATSVLPRSTPESVGIESARIAGFLDGIEAGGLELHSLMLLRHGKVVAEGWWHPYRRDDVHMLYSLSKSFASTAIGFAVAEGLLGLDDTVVSFFPEDVPTALSANLLAMRVRHLLSMSVGHEDDETPLGARNWARGFLARPVPFEPGARFVYNSSATFMLSAILQKLTGQRLLDYLRPRLLDPIGIERATWAQNPDGIDFGGWGMYVTTDSIARFGQLYLQDGIWEGGRVLPEGWVTQATRAHVSNGDDPNSDWAQGYGFQFWRCRHDAYRGDGAYGQYCVVVPDKGMVIAITSSVDDMQAVLNQVWEDLVLPASEASLPEDPAANQALQGRLAKLELAKPRWQGRTNPEASVYKVEDQTWSFIFKEDAVELTITDPKGRHEILAGKGAWVYGATDLINDGPVPIAVASGWTEDGALELRIRLVEEPTAISYFVTFVGDELQISSKRRGRFMDPEGPRLIGTRLRT